ncbi:MULTISPECIES: hypothetical protein [Shewanella]|uniref:hypothetical protein n=1 Tax=Shewanella TaxID=22 RepID=UPI00201ACCC6|nr:MULTISPECIES: hypothetical protein [Shewanella]
MPNISVKILRFINSEFPGWVECVLFDANGQSHFFIEKAPVVSSENLSASSNYPRHGVIGCELESQWANGAGQMLACVCTDLPWGIESTAGATRFVVLSSQIICSEPST